MSRRYSKGLASWRKYLLVRERSESDESESQCDILSHSSGGRQPKSGSELPMSRHWTLNRLSPIETDLSESAKIVPRSITTVLVKLGELAMFEWTQYTNAPK